MLSHVSQINTQRISLCIYIAQLRHKQENAEKFMTCLYLPDDALIMQNIYREILLVLIFVT